MNAFPIKPPESLLIDALRGPTPRPVRYSAWVRLTRVVMLNGWIAGVLLLQVFLTPAKKDGVWLLLAAGALLMGGVFLLIECHFRWRRHLLANGSATVGVVLSREAIIRDSNQVDYHLHYRYWISENSPKDATVHVPKRVYDGCPDGSPITIIYDPRFRTGSLPLFLLHESELI